MTRQRHVFPLSHASVTATVAEVRRRTIRSAHYVGMADEGLIRALQAEPGLELSIMDYFDRWGGSTRFFEGGEGLQMPPCPDWLQDVTCYHEGFPKADLLVWDLKTNPEDAELLQNELLSSLRFAHIVLFGRFARSATCNPNYVWQRLMPEGWAGTRR